MFNVTYLKDFLKCLIYNLRLTTTFMFKTLYGQSERSQAYI